MDAQADLSLRWAHTHFVGFVMSRLILSIRSCKLLSIYSGRYVILLNNLEMDSKMKEKNKKKKKKKKKQVKKEIKKLWPVPNVLL